MELRSDRWRGRELAAEKRRQRHELLAELYEVANGGVGRFVDAEVVAGGCGLYGDDEGWRDAVSVLAAEGLVEQKPRRLALTAAGAALAERLLVATGEDAWQRARDRALTQQEERLGVLVALYEGVEGSETKDLTWSALQTAIHGDNDALERAWHYLRREDLVTGEKHSRIKLTHRGLVEVERALTRPAEATEHFPAPIIMHFHSVGAVQTGANATAHVAQTVQDDGTPRWPRR